METLDLEQTAQLLFCSTDTIQRLVEKGLPAYQPGKKLVFIRDEVIQWVKDNARKDKQSNRKKASHGYPQLP